MKEGAVPGTLFRGSESGWMNGELYIDWFKFFLQQISTALYYSYKMEMHLIFQWS